MSKQLAMSHAELVEAAEKLVPLIREKAREAELARRPLDEVIRVFDVDGLRCPAWCRQHLEIR